MVLNQKQKLIRIVRSNRQPILMLATNPPLDAEEISVTPDELQRRITLIRDKQDFHERVGEALSKRFPEEEPSPYVEKRIYDGFVGREDERIMSEFHRLDWEKRVELCDRFNDPRLDEISRRLLYFERPDCLSSEERLDMESWIKARMMPEEEDVPWTTIPKAKSDLANLRKSAPETSFGALNDIESFINGLENRFSSA